MKNATVTTNNLSMGILSARGAGFYHWHGWIFGKILTTKSVTESVTAVLTSLPKLTLLTVPGLTKSLSYALAILYLRIRLTGPSANSSFVISGLRIIQGRL
jgi:hypothetical protein